MTHTQGGGKKAVDENRLYRLDLADKDFKHL